jgi:hypothetical protein
MQQTHKRKLLNLCLLLSSLVGYLEWGTDNRSFLGAMEWHILTKTEGLTDGLTHPFVIIPLLGQLLLIITLFQKTPSKVLTIAGLVCLSLILMFIFFIGLTGMNIKIALSAVPFIISGIAVIYNFRKKQVRT